MREQLTEALTQQGVALWRGAFYPDALQPLTQAAQACFQRVEQTIAQVGPEAAVHQLPPAYQFNAYSTSVHLDALNDFLGDDGLGMGLKAVAFWWQLLQAVEGLAECCRERGGFTAALRSQLRLRKQYAPGRGHPQHQPNQWHQDGGLGVKFPPQPNVPPYCITPLKPLLTGWLPLSACGRIAPGLELICVPQAQLLHYQALNSAALSACFPEAAFWCPQLALGDLLLFERGTVHRTAVTPAMERDRLSLEWRLVNPTPLPASFSNETLLPVFE
ncbi:MAG: hypothetical protein AAGG51_22415 [Cyanobacteria bacterium P01_G01_bin.54]